MAAGSFLAVLLNTAPAGSVSSTLGFENGYTVPARGDIRVLIAFAEVDFLPCGGGSTQGLGAHPNWPEKQPPLDKDDYYDVSLAGGPHAFLTDYYYQMSFGNYRVTGDYFADIVTLSCREALSSDHVIEVLNTRPVVTAHNLVMDDFDQWTPTSPGAAKVNAGNGRIDVLMVVWRNVNPNNGSECGGCFTGWMSQGGSVPLGNKTGFDNVGNFAAWGSGISGWGIFIHEYMHAIFGGNNWHIGDGADSGTFHFTQGPWGMTAHSPAASNVANAWDRDHLKWKPPSKRYYISASDLFRREVKSDISIGSHPDGGLFVLRDFVQTGDAVRIKLPHITWEPGSPPCPWCEPLSPAPKNQYIWLENHQRKSRFDANGADVPCQGQWSRGLYAYVQVGKDSGAADLNGDGLVNEYDLYPYSGSPWLPNALGSWLLPLSAEGRRDFMYRFDLATPPDPTMPCQWGNASMPVEHAMSLPNPFTGYSELFTSVDANTMLTNPVRTLIPFGDGYLLSGEPKSVLTEVVNGQVVRTLPASGGPLQAFSFANRSTRLNIATNPAPVPVYTHESQWGYLLPNLQPPDAWENQTIWLNGLSIELLRENIDGHGAILVSIRWDDWRVDRDVRWTGNIALATDAGDPRRRESRVVVTPSRNLYLDRGLSPTRDWSNDEVETVFPFGRPTVYPPGLLVEHGQLFTDPTVMTLKTGTRLHLQRNAKLWIQNGSVLNVEAGAEVLLDPGAAIAFGPGGGDTHVDGTVRLTGDLDGNGCVDRRDLSLLMRGLYDWRHDDPRYDLNEDGQANWLDAVWLSETFTRRFGALCTP